MIYLLLCIPGALLGLCTIAAMIQGGRCEHFAQQPETVPVEFEAPAAPIVSSDLRACG